MGILTRIDDEWDEEAQVHRIFAATKFGISSRGSLNRVASRAAVMTGVGQRTLVAAAYDVEGIDLVWSKGLGVVVDPEEKYEKAKEINYRSIPIEQASEIGDILPIWFRDALEFGEFGEGEVLHIWEIPFEIE